MATQKSLGPMMIHQVVWNLLMHCVWAPFLFLEPCLACRYQLRGSKSNQATWFSLSSASTTLRDFDSYYGHRIVVVSPWKFAHTPLRSRDGEELAHLLKGTYGYQMVQMLIFWDLSSSMLWLSLANHDLLAVLQRAVEAKESGIDY